MRDPLVDRQAVEAAIRSAFAGVRLGLGVSLRQAEGIDRTIFGIQTPNWGVLPRDEVTDDWTKVPDDELLRDNIAHLDGEGLRYYLPEFMLWLLDHYEDDDRLFVDGADMAAIGTIAAIAPLPEFAQSREETYATWFTDDQRRAIAAYVEALPDLISLDWKDAELLRQSLDRFWSRLLGGGTGH